MTCKCLDGQFVINARFVQRLLQTPSFEERYGFNFRSDGGVLTYALPDGRNVNTAPMIALAIPPKSSHSVLLVGAPVKAREMLELAESDALKP